VSREPIAVGESFEFALPAAGSGGERTTATELAAEYDVVMAVLLRSHYCPRSRRFVTALADAYGTFAGRGAAIVPVLPDRIERAAVWQRRYDLPFSLLADPASDDEDGYDAFAEIADLIAHRPGLILFAADGDQLRFVRSQGGEQLAPNPSIETLRETVDAIRATDVTAPAEPAADTEPVGDL
jgi:peroxiredoxin Q/BCP